jgi:uncharacterized protein (DUF3084 family)
MGLSNLREETGADLSLTELMGLLGSSKKMKEALEKFIYAARKANKATKTAEIAQAERDKKNRQARAELEKEDRAMDKKRDAIAKREARIEGIDADATEREARIQQGPKELRAGQASQPTALGVYRGKNYRRH